MINDHLLMLSEEMPEWNKSPQTLGGTTVKFSLIVDNADEAFAKAIDAGATELMPLTDQFYGFRCGNVRDPYGHEWMIQHQTEKVSPEEMQRRWDAMGSGGGDAS
jgi:PhnB protein